MRKVSVIFCTYPSIYSDLVLERLLNASHIQVVAIIESTRVLKKQGYVLIDSIKLLKKVGLYYAFYLFLITTGYSILSVFSKRKKIIRNKNPQKEETKVSSFCGFRYKRYAFMR